MFGLQTPLYLVGLLSAAIPLLIHLSRSRKTRTLRFSTTRFLTDQFLRSYRMSRLKELLLLAARMALCALLAMTFAEPFLQESIATGDPSASRSVVIVLDDSASMHYRDTDGETLLSRAAREATGIVKGLKASDSVSIVLAGRRAEGPLAVYPEPTTDMGGIENFLLGLAEQANGADGRREALGTDLAGGVLVAERMLAERDESSHEVYVFSDLQQRGLTAPVLSGVADDAFDSRVVFVPVRPTGPISNLAITAVQYGASRPMAGIPFSIRPHIRNDGDTPRACTISLHVRAGEDDGDADEEGYRKVAEVANESLEPGRWSVHTLHHTFHAGGWQAGYVSVDDPNLSADNRRYFCFEVLDAVNVVAVNGAPSSIRRNDELFFLQTALAAGGAETNPIRVTGVRSNAFQGASLDDVRLVILANVESLPEAAVGKLERFVDRGGSLLVFLGDQAQPAFYNKFLAGSGRARGGLLPAQLVGSVAKGHPAGGDDQPSVIGIGEFAEDHPALSGFGSGETGRLGAVGFSAYWGIDPTASSRVVMEADNGDPLLCEHLYGQGRVALFASSCDRDWSNFPVRPAFLPFVYRLVGYLAQSAGGQSSASETADTEADSPGTVAGNFFRTGQTIRQAVPVGGASQRLRVVKPDRTIGVFEAVADPTLRQVAFDETDQPGVYRFDETGSDGNGRAFAVNLEAGESDLSSLEVGEKPIEVLGESLPWITESQLVVVDDAAQLGAQAGVGRSRSDLWEILLWIVLVIAVLEPALANWITSRHYLKPRSDGPRTIAVPTGRVSLGGDIDAVTETRESVSASSSS
ncbi:MAG: BatA domain-containing protein [Planctomycetota bacterium]|nr:BatA domain-containing protein [Planctomycetota bacterium]